MYSLPKTHSKSAFRIQKQFSAWLSNPLQIPWPPDAGILFKQELSSVFTISISGLSLDRIHTLFVKFRMQQIAPLSGSSLIKPLWIQRVF